MDLAAPPPASSPPDPPPPRTARGVTPFVVGSALALGLLVFVLLVRSDTSDTASSRALRLMPTIGAELIGAPLTPEQAAWPLEGPDGPSTLAAALPRDTLIFLNFWATWCAPCREELPSMFRLRDALADRRFAMVAVSYDESWADIDTAFRRWFTTPPPRSALHVLRDPAADDAHALRTTFGTTQIPDTYVLLNGRVLARFVNTRDWSDPKIINYFRNLAPQR